mmetsp:Transcript_58419/g.173871  ORF Transcript_58419/g.173871 Transcript_58419/m.173871 type:complete len:263 (-) Transcript_58419:273-1061(-)
MVEEEGGHLRGPPDEECLPQQLKLPRGESAPSLFGALFDHPLAQRESVVRHVAQGDDARPLEPHVLAELRQALGEELGLQVKHETHALQAGNLAGMQHASLPSVTLLVHPSAKLVTEDRDKLADLHVLEAVPEGSKTSQPCVPWIAQPLHASGHGNLCLIPRAALVDEASQLPRHLKPAQTPVLVAGLDRGTLDGLLCGLVLDGQRLPRLDGVKLGRGSQEDVAEALTRGPPGQTRELLCNSDILRIGTGQDECVDAATSGG